MTVEFGAFSGIGFEWLDYCFEPEVVVLGAEFAKDPKPPLPRPQPKPPHSGGKHITKSGKK